MTTLGLRKPSDGTPRLPSAADHAGRLAIHLLLHDVPLRQWRGLTAASRLQLGMAAGLTIREVELADSHLERLAT